MPAPKSEIDPLQLADSTGGMTGTALDPYLRNAVLTATPEQLQLMLYDGAIRYCLQAQTAIEGMDYETSYERLTRAQNIILEMQAGLKYEVNPSLCERMASIYNFLYRKLVDANCRRDVLAIGDALKILRMERETWRLLVERVQRAAEGAEPTGRNSHEHAAAAVGFRADG